MEQAKQRLLEVIKNNSLITINNNNNNNETKLIILIDILCGMIIVGLIGSMICLSIFQVNFSMEDPITWAFTLLIASVIRFIVTIQNIGKKISTNTVINIINENPLIQCYLILFESLCLLGNIILILEIWKKLSVNDNKDDYKNNDFSNNNKPPTPGRLDPTSNLELEIAVSEFNIESEDIKLNVSKP